MPNTDGLRASLQHGVDLAAILRISDVRQCYMLAITMGWNVQVMVHVMAIYANNS